MTRRVLLLAVASLMLVPAFAAAAPLFFGPPGWEVTADRSAADEPGNEADPETPAPSEDLENDQVHALPRRFSYRPPSPSAVHERHLPADPLNHRPQPVEPPPNRASRP